MSQPAAHGLLAIDVGSSRVKFGWFPAAVACTSDIKPSQLPIAAPKLPEPEHSLAVSHQTTSPEQFSQQLHDWLDESGIHQPSILLGSVHAEAAAKVQSALSEKSFPPPRQLFAADLPITIQVEHPQKVGIDRLLNAIAVNCLRKIDSPAIVVDLGTANTVDLITAQGAFAGGAILPGIAMSARVLHESTSTLPYLPPSTFESAAESPPEVVGKSTHPAIASGLYWGAVGAVNEIIARMSQDLSQPPQLFITGGDARLVAPNIQNNQGPARHVPHLVLAGIQLAAEELL